MKAFVIFIVFFSVVTFSYGFPSGDSKKDPEPTSASPPLPSTGAQAPSANPEAPPKSQPNSASESKVDFYICIAFGKRTSFVIPTPKDERITIDFKVDASEKESIKFKEFPSADIIAYRNSPQYTDVFQCPMYWVLND